MMRRMMGMAALLVFALVSGGSAEAQGADGRTADARAGGQGAADRPVVIASKPFGESYLLAEMFAQLLEGRGIPVDRRMGLGATEIAFGALRTGAIDVYPEYTGTGLLAILGEPPQPDPAAVYGRVSREFAARWGVRWLPPLGFENTYAIAVRRETAEREGLRTLSDLAGASPRLRAGFTPDFIGREDGLPGLQAAYDLRPRSVRPLVQAVKYQALAQGSVDVIDGYSTDGLIDRYRLVVLRGRPPLLSPVRGRRARERPIAARPAGRRGGAHAPERAAGRGDDAGAEPAAGGGWRARRARGGGCAADARPRGRGHAGGRAAGGAGRRLWARTCGSGGRRCCGSRGGTCCSWPCRCWRRRWSRCRWA